MRQISSEVERDACIARELSQQLNQHDEVSIKICVRILIVLSTFIECTESSTGRG